MTTTSLAKTMDPAIAKRYFEERLAFITGPVELSQMIERKENITIIDVREAEDYRKGHIPGAINCPKEDWDQYTGLSKDKLNIVYCYDEVCQLAAKACLVFASRGFPVMHLEGAFAKWQQKGMPVER